MTKTPGGGGHEPLDCRMVLRQLWEYLDGELDTERERAVREHLDLCARCYPHYDFEKAFLQAIAASRDTASAPASLRARVEQALRAEGFVPEIR